MDEIVHKSLPFLALLVVWLVAMIGMGWYKRTHSRGLREVQLALLSKFQSGEEITKFLTTEEGRRLLDQLGGPVEDPRHKTVGLAVGACVNVGIGIAFAIGSRMLDKPDLILPALIMGAIGTGLAVGAVLSHRLSRERGSTRKDD